MNGYSQFCHAENGPMCPVTSVRERGRTFMAGWERSEFLGLIATEGNHLQARPYSAIIMNHGEYNDFFPVAMSQR